LNFPLDREASISFNPARAGADILADRNLSKLEAVFAFCRANRTLSNDLLVSGCASKTANFVEANRRLEAMTGPFRGFDDEWAMHGQYAVPGGGG
jgi:hypothetical protein